MVNARLSADIDAGNRAVVLPLDAAKLGMNGQDSVTVAIRYALTGGNTVDASSCADPKLTEYVEAIDPQGNKP
jgi:hypothetical protein